MILKLVDIDPISSSPKTWALTLKSPFWTIVIVFSNETIGLTNRLDTIIAVIIAIIRHSIVII